MQLLAMMDAAVQAASSGTHVEAFLEVCPILFLAWSCPVNLPIAAPLIFEV